MPDPATRTKAAGPEFGISVSKAIVGDVHSCPRNDEARREPARRRQNIAAAQSPDEDRSPELAVDLSRQVSPAAQADMEFHCSDFNA